MITLPNQVTSSDEVDSVCLCLASHAFNLSSFVGNIKDIERFADCHIFVANMKQFKAHRVVLSAISPYFNAVLRNCETNSAAIVCPEVTSDQMRLLLEYIYTGEIVGSKSLLEEVIRVAHVLQIKGLCDSSTLHPDRRIGKRLLEEFFSGTKSTICVPCDNSYKERGPNPISKYLEVTSLSEICDSNASSSHLSQSASTFRSASNSSAESSYSAATTYLCEATPKSSLKAPSSRQKAHGTPYSRRPKKSSENATVTNGAAQPVPITFARNLSPAYEAPADNNPLRRKKISSYSSMLMNYYGALLVNSLAGEFSGDASTGPKPLNNLVLGAMAQMAVFHITQSMQVPPDGQTNKVEEGAQTLIGDIEDVAIAGNAQRKVQTEIGDSHA